MSTKENQLQAGILIKLSRQTIFAMMLILFFAWKTAAQSGNGTNFEFKQCNEDVIAFRVDPKPIQRAVGEEFTLLLSEGKAMVAILVQDCEQYWIDGENLGSNHHVHLLARIKGPTDVRPVIGAAQTEETLTWFSLFAGSTNPRDQEARKASHTAPKQIVEVSLDPIGSMRGGRVVISPDLNFTWKAGVAEESPHLGGYNHDIYVRDERGNIILKRIQAIGKLVAKPVQGILTVQGNDALAEVIEAGQYPALVYTIFPIWARGNLGEDLTSTAENNRAMILKYIEEMNKGNASYLDEYFDPDVIFHGVTGTMDLDQFKAFHHQVLMAFPRAVMQAEDILVSGDKVITRWRMTGKHEGPFMGIPPTGRDIAISGILISRFDNGKVVEEWEEANIAGLLQQLEANSEK